MKAIYVRHILNESNFVSKFRRGMKVQTKDNTYYIKKVEDHSYKYDLIYTIDKYGKHKIFASDWLEQNGSIIKSERKKSISSITTREYTRILKDAITGLRQTIDDDEDPGSYIYDTVESMIYDESIYNYLYKKYKKLYDMNPRYKRDLIELMTNDISNLYYIN